MTGRAIVILALAATGLLVVGARLVDGASRPGAVLGVVALVAGISLAAAAVAGAWRTPERTGGPEAEPAPTPQAPRRTPERVVS